MRDVVSENGHWPARLVLGLLLGVGALAWMVVRWNTWHWGAFVYNGPIALVLGLWLTTAAGWFRDRRWLPLAAAAVTLAAVAVRLRTLSDADPSAPFPASGHVTFLVFALVGARRDRLVFWPAAVVLAEVAVIKYLNHDLWSLAAGLVLGGLLGLAVRLAERGRSARHPVAEAETVE